MQTFKFDKLVRDNIPDLLKKKGIQINNQKTLEDGEFLEALVEKLIEESNELKQAKNLDDQKEEIADIQEILVCLKTLLNLTEDKLREIQNNKRNKNGSFEKRIYIDSVSTEDGNKNSEYFLNNPMKYPIID